MLKFNYKRRLFNICEMAFGTFDDTLIASCDVVYMHSNESEWFKTNNNGIIVQKQYTLVNSLIDEEEKIFANIKKNCRYEIRRSEREGTLVKIYKYKELLEDSNVVDRFQNTYNMMFKIKGANNKFNRCLVDAGVKSGKLIISVGIAAGDTECEVFHAYLVDGVNSVLMYSTSSLWKFPGDHEKINNIGRINKYLHWKDMIWLKNMQYQRYEWGGISSHDNPNGIDKFKMEFGGEMLTYYNYIIPHTPLGYIYIYLAKKRSKNVD